MAAKFLTEEWMTGLTSTVNASDAFTTAIANTEMRLQFLVTDVPDRGNVQYHIDISGGSATVAPGELDNPDATVTNDYETAEAISKGDLNTQMAFMTGKLKVQGDMAKLMMNQAALNQFAKAAEALEVEY